MRPRPSYANIVSTFALVVALGGTGAYAAGLAKDSVRSKQIKNNAVKTVDIKDGTLDSVDVKDGALTSADIQDDSIKGSDVDESSLVLPAVPQVVEGATDTSVHTLSGDTTVATLSFTAPADGFVKVTGMTSFHANSTDNYIDARIFQDASKIQGNWWDAGDVDTWFDQRQTMEGVVAVTAGAHTYTLKLQQSGGTAHTYTEAQLTLEYFPQGSAPAGPAHRAAQ